MERAFFYPINYQMKVQKKARKRVIMKENFSQFLKMLIISFLVSLNVCVWRDVLQDTFDEAVMFIALFILGMFLRGRILRNNKR